MKIIARFFGILLVLVFLASGIFVFLTSDYLKNYFEEPEDIDKDEHCLNLPPKYYVHPVFLASGPPIQAEPRPFFAPNRTEKSSIINCNLQNKTLIIFHSHVNHTKVRTYQRSVLNRSWLEKNNAVVYFVVGQEDESNIDNELENFGDILQTDIVENYHNISYKAMFWINELYQCDVRPELIVKIDDDVLVDLIGLEFLIKRYYGLDDFIACRVLPNGQIVRNNQSKWYLSHEEYKFNNLGTYCQGMAYLLGKNLISVMHDNMDRTQILWMDDWYVTRALIGEHKISYYSLDQHVMSINSEKELLIARKNIEQRKYRTIFGHFRPARRFPILRRKRVWANVTEFNNSCDIMSKYRKNYAAVY